MNDEGWWFQAVEGFCFMTDWQTDNICDCRVAFATENGLKPHFFGTPCIKIGFREID